MSRPAEELALLIRGAERAVALTGAGVSTDAGIPDFRSPASGLWKHADPSKVASIQGFHADPLGFYAFWRERFVGLASAQPASAHVLLAKLEARGLLRAVVTQNIDGLHQRAGSRRVIEVHGTFESARCLRCRERYDTARFVSELSPGEMPACLLCGGLVKPDVVLFGEELGDALHEAERAVDDCDLLVAMGSSLAVWPVAGLVERAAAAGAKVAIVNREATGEDGAAHLIVRGELRDVVAAVSRELHLPA